MEIERLLEILEKPLPRYTSYPTANVWEKISSEPYKARLAKLQSPLSLYIHIPFCEKMCLFCGCSVVLNRKRENEEKYVEALIHEIESVAKKLPCKMKVTQLHFGGGTPTKLDFDLFSRLYRKIDLLFDLEGEIAIEIDPRTIFRDPQKLRDLRKLGFNRVSFGVQDIDPKVQEAIRREQSLEMTEMTYALSRELQFEEVNLDLIYGLPYQTCESFRRTISKIIQLSPDRIALFSYAKIPHIKPHQRAIDEKTLPETKVKFQIYSEARRALIEADYSPIGMDHFARKGSSLQKSYLEKSLHRNFQGYTIKRAERMIGFGMSAISDLGDAFFQNDKDLSGYYRALEEGELPILRGKILTEEDVMRRSMIQSLMCHFYLKKPSSRFSDEMERLKIYESLNLIEQTKEEIRVLPKGELFIRNIASTFDAYLEVNPQKFSSSI